MDKIIRVLIRSVTFYKGVVLLICKFGATMNLVKHELSLNASEINNLQNVWNEAHQKGQVRKLKKNSILPNK